MKTEAIFMMSIFNGSLFFQPGQKALDHIAMVVLQSAQATPSLTLASLPTAGYSQVVNAPA
jgi:hypothetical protein